MTGEGTPQSRQPQSIENLRLDRTAGGRCQGLDHLVTDAQALFDEAQGREDLKQALGGHRQMVSSVRAQVGEDVATVGDDPARFAFDQGEEREHDHHGEDQAFDPVRLMQPERAHLNRRLLDGAKAPFDLALLFVRAQEGRRSRRCVGLIGQQAVDTIEAGIDAQLVAVEGSAHVQPVLGVDDRDAQIRHHLADGLRQFAFDETAVAVGGAAQPAFDRPESVVGFGQVFRSLMPRGRAVVEARAVHTVDLRNGLGLGPRAK